MSNEATCYLEGKFIKFTHYDFTDDNGKRVVGNNILCYLPRTNEVVKVKAIGNDTTILTAFNFGDSIEVGLNYRNGKVSFIYDCE